MNWFSRLFKREAKPDYTSYRLAASLGYGGAGGRPAIHTAITETAAGIWGRAFASAQITPQTRRTRFLTPSLLTRLARDLVLRGDAVFALRIQDDEVKAYRATDFSARGGANPKTWIYTLQLQGAQASTSIVLPAASVIHAQWSTDDDAAGYGVSPLARASHSSALLGGLISALCDEVSNAARGYLLPVPAADTDDTSDNLADMRRDIESLAGSHSLVETTAAGWGEGRAAAPLSDYAQKRLGAEPPQTLIALLASAEESILAACGVPLELGRAGNQGTAKREAWRLFLYGSVKPVAKAVASELTTKLGVDVSITFEDLMASDILGRAAAFKSLTSGGMPVADAARVAGVD